MTQYCWHKLTVLGQTAEIKKFKEGLSLDKHDNCCNNPLEAYFPCPMGKHDRGFDLWANIAYDAFFNPNPKAFMNMTRKQLAELVLSKHPDVYEKALEYRNNMFKYGFMNWSDWHARNWNTKWVEDTRLIEQGPNHLVFKFDSAWTPVVEGYDHIAALFPELTFFLIYAEPGEGFRGLVYWDKGKKVMEHFENWMPEVGEDGLIEGL